MSATLQELDELVKLLSKARKSNDEAQNKLSAFFDKYSEFIPILDKGTFMERQELRYDRKNYIIYKRYDGYQYGFEIKVEIPMQRFVDKVTNDMKEQAKELISGLDKITSKIRSFFMDLRNWDLLHNYDYEDGEFTYRG